MGGSDLFIPGTVSRWGQICAGITAMIDSPDSNLCGETYLFLGKTIKRRAGLPIDVRTIGAHEGNISNSTMTTLSTSSFSQVFLTDSSSDNI